MPHGFEDEPPHDAVTPPSTDSEPRARDPRSEYVRAKLFSAAESLGERGENFSVSALVRRAGVSRSVFYVHFADLRGFVLELQRERLAEIAATAFSQGAATPEEAMLGAQRRLVAHFAANQQLYRAAFANTGFLGIAHGTVEAIADALLAHMETLAPPPAGLLPDLTAKHFAYAATGLLSEWVLGLHHADQETIARHLFLLMPTWMYQQNPQADVVADNGPKQHEKENHESITRS